MAITDLQVRLVRESFERLRPDFELQSVNFYSALFRRAPELRSMFREDLAGQGMRFMTTLDAIVQRLDDDIEVASQYRELGRTHRSLGVHASHFEPMGEALVETLANALGDAFDADMEAAWRAAYATVAENMIRRGDIPE